MTARLRLAEWFESWRWCLLAITASLALLASFGRIGGDWDWMVALGDHIRATGAVPDSVPFADADTSGWHNVQVVAELLSSLIHEAGGRAAVLAHLGLVALTLSVLAAAARARGSSDRFVAVVIGAVVLGSLPTLVIVRAQTYSLVMFALLLALVAGQACKADRRIWLAVPLVVVWGNLHGAALLGVCVLGAYLVFGRLRSRPAESVAVGVASLVSLSLTPQLWDTPRYYAQVFDNVSAQRAEGLWVRPSLGAPLDVLMLLVAAALVVALLRTRREVWEYVAVLGLCLATASAARHGVWLLFLLAVLSAWRPAEPVARSAHVKSGTLSLRWVVALAAVAMVVAAPLMLARGDAVLGAPPQVVDAVTEVAADGVVLAPAPLSEALAVAGVRLWAGNPLDAFTHEDQAAYLDFLDGASGAGVAIAEVDVVVALEGSAQAGLVSDDPDFAGQACGPDWTCFVRR